MRRVQYFLISMLSFVTLASTQGYVRRIPTTESPPANITTKFEVFPRFQQEPDTTNHQDVNSDTIAGDHANHTIRGGFNAGAVPHFVQFIGGNICAGSLVWNDVVLTAAHCVDGGFPGSVRVGPSTASDGVVQSVVGGAIHPDWTGNFDSGTDAAVMKLGNGVDKPTIVLNTDANRPGSGQDILVVGFGQTSNGQYPSNLQGAYLPYSGDCFSNAQYFCTESSGKSTCAGDSGAPLVLRGTNIQVGLVSFGNSGSCNSNTISGYQKIVNVEGWVQQQICALSSNPPSGCSGCGGGGNACVRAIIYVGSIVTEQFHRGQQAWRTWTGGR